MLAVNYKNLLTRMYPELPRIFNLETAAYLHSATAANVSVATFYLPKGTGFISSRYLIGIAVDDFEFIPTEERNGFTVTPPTRTLQDLFKYEDLVDPQVTFDFVSWFASNLNINPCDYLDTKYHREVHGILKEGWSHGNR